MDRLGRPGPKPPQFGELINALSTQLDPKAKELERLKNDAGQRLERSDLAAVWKKGLERDWENRDKLLLTLLEKIDPWRTQRLRTAIGEVEKLAEVVHSFEALCETLDQAAKWPQSQEVDPTRARYQYEDRKRVADRIAWVREAVAAAGECSATAKFPKKQLALLEAEIGKDVEVLFRERDAVQRKPTPSIKPAEVETLAGAAATLARLLDRPELEAQIAAAAGKVGKKELATLRANLGAFAILTDEALHAPDYSRLGKGWFHPRSRSAYRDRMHDEWTRFGSEKRQDVSKVALTGALEAALDAGDPSKALGDVLIASFLREIGADPEATRRWKPSAEAIRTALATEAFLPLRALNETIDGMLKGDPKLRVPVKQAVERITEHVVEGDFREWRYDNAAGRRQLENLGEAKVAKWKDSLHLEHEAHDGVKLKTREEDGLDLLWLTKIGGPSHGFDYGGECLLPLLSNARTKAIVVDDPRWPHNAAARAYLRVLHFDNGVPTLFLEPLQRDFPHRDQLKNEDVEDKSFQRSILLHAIEKAKEMKLTLSIGPWLADTAKELGIEVEHHYHHKYVLKASNGVYEASDTLSHKHDWPQMHDETTDGLERLLYVPPGL